MDQIVVARDKTSFLQKMQEKLGIEVAENMGEQVWYVIEKTLQCFAQAAVSITDWKFIISNRIEAVGARIEEHDFNAGYMKVRLQFTSWYGVYVRYELDKPTFWRGRDELQRVLPKAKEIFVGPTVSIGYRNKRVDIVRAKRLVQASPHRPRMLELGSEHAVLLALWAIDRYPQANTGIQVTWNSAVALLQSLALPTLKTVKEIEDTIEALCNKGLLGKGKNKKDTHSLYLRSGGMQQARELANPPRRF
jgi:hypothetical protein